MLAKTSENLDYDELCRPPAAGQERSLATACFPAAQLTQNPRSAALKSKKDE